MSKVSRTRLLRFEDGTVIKNLRLLTRPGSAHLTHSDLVPLGEGGSGIVYLAAQTLHENVEVMRAIKFFMYRDDIADLTAHGTPVSKDDFLTEVVNIAGLRHEHLTKVIDAGMYSVEGLAIPYLVTEYIHGPTLRDVIEGKWQPDSEVESFKNDPAAILVRNCNVMRH